MKKSKNIILVVFLIMFSTCGFSQGEIPVRNHILIIDKTGSMKGYKGSPNIWAEVKSAVKGYIDNVEIGDKVTLYTYHEKVDPVKIFNVTGDNIKNKINNVINKLQANGKYTCTYKALDTIFNSLSKEEINIIQLYTDGANSNIAKCGLGSLQSTLSNYKLRKGELDYLFYITLGFKPSSEIIDSLGEYGTVISDLKGGVPSLNILSPKALSLEFSKYKLSLNQGFLLVSATDLDSAFKVKIDQSQMIIGSLTGTEDNPEFVKYSYSAFSDEKITLKFLQELDNVPEGIYLGYYKYKVRPSKESYTYVIPNKVKIVFRNITKSTVKIRFKDVIND